MKPWAMLAVNYDTTEFDYPVYVQKKLNGVRAKWDVDTQQLVTRQNHIIPEHVLPSLYKDLKENYQAPHSLDGELWGYCMSFQELCGAVNSSRNEPHFAEQHIHLCAFDVISKRPYPREPFWDTSIPYELCESKAHLQEILDTIEQPRYDGLILRIPGTPYIVGRTEALIKLKPWRYETVTVLERIEGQGKFKGMVGSFWVALNGKRFYVGGGNITENTRRVLFQHAILTPKLKIKYRELSNNGIPLQPQIVEICQAP